MRQTRTRRLRLPRRPDFCAFCKSGKGPDYKDSKALEGFITDRGKIVARSRSGLCAKHQRRLAAAVKRARILALLPFSQRV